MRSVATEERRSRLARRHFLTSPAETVEEAAGGLVGLHATDPASVYLAAYARVAEIEPEDLGDALYDRRTLLRILGMRRTMFVVPHDVGATIDAACTRALAPSERRRLISMIEEQHIATDGAAWVDRVVAMTLDALHARGEATATELRETIPELRETLVFGEGKKWGGQVGISTRVLFLMATEGSIVRGRPLGTWLSSQYRWTPTETWIKGGLAAIPTEEAENDLARRWLAAFGPGTETDLKWWTGWGIRQTRNVLGRVGAVEVELDSGIGYVLPEDHADRDDRPEPWVALLPSLDPTTMGWKERDWYVGPHKAALFDRNGNAGPTAWLDGRVVGGWSQRENGEVVVRLLEDVGADAEQRLDTAAHRIGTWLRDVRLTPRFRTPLEKELAS